MGQRIPPIPPPAHIVDARIKAGAKTMREIDPAFADWCDAGKRIARFQVACFIAGMSALIAFGVFLFFNAK